MKKRSIHIMSCGKSVRVMKLVLLFCFCVFTKLSAAASDQLVKIPNPSQTYQSLFDQVEKQTGLITLFSNNELDMTKTITLNSAEYSLNTLFTIVLKGTNLDFEITNKYIVIRPKGQLKKKESVQEYINGKVVDSDGRVLAGVSVIKKGTKNITISDKNGSFKIPIDPDKDDKIEGVTLLFSFVGMKPHEELIQGTKNNLIIQLEEKISDLNEVVVTGYQTVNRKDMVGSYSTIKTKDIAMPTATTIDQLLQGQIAGMVVTNNSIRAGSSAQISIRGTSTILGNKSPLWVVDGIIQDDISKVNGSVSALISSGASDNVFSDIIGSQISWLNPNDIETVTVLKDASATAVYGSKASNGVIVITTKKGNKDRLSVNYSSNYSLSMRPTYNNYYLMNSKERINFSKEAYEAGAYYNSVPKKQINTYEGLMRMYLEGDIEEDYFVKRYSYLETVNTDWLNLLTRNSFGQNQFISFSGGTSKSSYVASLSYNSTQGIEKGNSNDRYTGRINASFDLSNKMKLDVAIIGMSSSTIGYAAGVNPQSYAITTSRTIPAYDLDGSSYLYYKKNTYYKYNVNTQETGLNFNILNEMNNTRSSVKSPEFDASANLTWNLNKSWTYQMTAGYKNNTRNSEAFADEKSYYITRNFRGYDYGSADPGSPEFLAALLPFGGQLISDYRMTESYDIQNKLNFSKTFNKVHRLNAMAVWEVKSSKTTAKYNTVWGFLPNSGETLASPTPLNKVVPLGTTFSTDNWGILSEIYSGGWASTNTTDNYVSAFSTIAYSYKDRYVINTNFRNDISNRFGQDINKRFDPTYSIGASWRISEENFAEKFKPALEQLVLRATFGVQGNALTNVSPEMILFKSTASTVYNQYVSNIRQLMNPYLSWERTKTWNFGLDFSAFDRLISANLEYYGRNTNAITNSKLLAEYGFNSSVPMEGTHIDNHGAEATINIVPFKTKKANLILGFNLSKNWNVATRIINNPNEVITTSNYLAGNGASNVLMETGYPIGGFWVYDFAGLDSKTGYPTFNFHTDKGTKYTDFLIYAGNRNPDITGGLNLRFTYNKISVVTYFAAIMGSKTLLPNPYSNFTSGNLPDPEYNLSKLLTQRWKQPGDELKTNIPSVFTSTLTELNLKDPTGVSRSIYDMWAQSTAQLVDGSFLRCRQVSLSWIIDSQFLKPLGARSLTLSATVNNIFVIANKRFNGMDPELGTSVMPKTYSLGLNVGF